MSVWHEYGEDDEYDSTPDGAWTIALMAVCMAVVIALVVR